MLVAWPGPRDAIELLRRMRQLPGHTFWTDDVSAAQEALTVESSSS